MVTVSKADADADFAESLGRARADAEAWLDARAAALAKEFPSIPVGWHRQQLIARTGLTGCACLAVITAVEGDKS